MRLLSITRAPWGPRRGKEGGWRLVVLHNAVADGNAGSAGLVPQADAVAPGEAAVGVPLRRRVAPQLLHAAGIALKDACAGGPSAYGWARPGLRRGRPVARPRFRIPALSEQTRLGAKTAVSRRRLYCGAQRVLSCLPTRGLAPCQSLQDVSHRTQAVRPLSAGSCMPGLKVPTGPF